MPHGRGSVPCAWAMLMQQAIMQRVVMQRVPYLRVLPPPPHDVLSQPVAMLHADALNLREPREHQWQGAAGAA